MRRQAAGELVAGHGPNVRRMIGRRLAAVRRNPRLYLGGLLLALICLGAVAAPLITPWSPTGQDLPQRLRPPAWVSVANAEHVLGTDGFGRDALSRLLYGARYSLLVACTAVLVSGLLGVLLAGLAGYFGHWWEIVIMRAVDAQQALSTVLLAIMVAALFGNNVLNLLLVLAVTGWATYTRILFGVVRSIRAQEYVAAAISLGTRPSTIVRRHVLPNMMSPIIVISTLQVGRMMLLEAGLSFLGMGVPEPLPAWGTMLSDGYRNIFTASYLTTIPGLAITVTVFAVNLLGDGLRRALDPRTRGMA